MRSKMNLSVLNVDFDTDKECRQALEELRWPKGVRCLRCNSEKISRISTRKQYDCDSCRYRFSVTTGTLFHDSHLPLAKWFLAILLMCEAKKGISANQMKRTLGVAHKTAWYLCHRIREAMKETNPEPLTGTVECDETYVGGRVRRGQGFYGNNPGAGPQIDKKAMVLGILQRNGNLRLTKGDRPTRETLHGFIRANAPNPQRIMTDDWAPYRGIADADTTHETVNHSAREYVRGDVTTNGIEGAFGLFKRGVVGSFHQISHKHLDRYLDEFEFRYNNRKNQYLFRDTITRLVQGPALPYQTLIA